MSEVMTNYISMVLCTPELSNKRNVTVPNTAKSPKTHNPTPVAKQRHTCSRGCDHMINCGDTYWDNNANHGPARDRQHHDCRRHWRQPRDGDHTLTLSKLGRIDPVLLNGGTDALGGNWRLLIQKSHNGTPLQKKKAIQTIERLARLYIDDLLHHIDDPEFLAAENKRIDKRDTRLYGIENDVRHPTPRRR